MLFAPSRTQKTYCPALLAPVWPFDTWHHHAYARQHVSSFIRRHDVLLSPDAGVWVETEQISSHPPGKSGWVSF